MPIAQSRRRFLTNVGQPPARNPAHSPAIRLLVDLDRRTRAGRVLKGVIRELTMHVGDATAPQRLLIQSAGLKAVRLALLSDQLLDGTPPSGGSDHHALAWLNSAAARSAGPGIGAEGAACD